ncbi:hypothetical protein BaRGS_00012746 [Batillaria attramentaria]|uniref:Uncharacterized protein n=1 Tax=Batillaria attramentaria TaxID=370345 RepID=A0ABD0LA14_9CAEN
MVLGSAGGVADRCFPMPCEANLEFTSVFPPLEMQSVKVSVVAAMLPAQLLMCGRMGCETYENSSQCVASVGGVPDTASSRTNSWPVYVCGGCSWSVFKTLAVAPVPEVGSTPA